MVKSPSWQKAADQLAIYKRSRGVEDGFPCSYKEIMHASGLEKLLVDAQAVSRGHSAAFLDLKSVLLSYRT